MSSTRIEWADAVWNPITGCTPVSEGCRNCYAKRMANRLKGRCGYPADDPFRPGTFHEDKLDEPLRWRKRRRVFVCSMGDLFHEAVDFSLIDRVLATVALCTQHTFMILTKRPERMLNYFLSGPNRWTSRVGAIQHHMDVHCARTCPPADFGKRGRVVIGDKWPLPNVWLGVSVEDQRTADERIPVLLQTPAAVRFVSCEPLLGPVSLTRATGSTVFEGVGADFGMGRDPAPLDWVICGAETGPKRRPTRPEWIRRLKDQCFFAGVPFFLKQMEVYGRIVKMPTLDGREWNQWPGVRS